MFAELGVASRLYSGRVKDNISKPFLSTLAKGLTHYWLALFALYTIVMIGRMKERPSRVLALWFPAEKSRISVFHV